MKPEVYVVGHRNPDTDSIAAAISYADLKKKLGCENVLPAMVGMPNPQTRFILERLAVDPPKYLADVHPKVSHVLKRPPVTAFPDMTLKEALELFHRHSVRVLPVVDEGNLPVGIVSLLKLSEKYLVTGSEPARNVKASLAGIASCLKGKFLAGEPESGVESFYLFIGAMQEDSFLSRIADYDPSLLLIMTGDRPSIQDAAIERRVRLLVITGGFDVKNELVEKAKKNGVTILSTSFDTASAAGFVKLASPLSVYAERKFSRIGVSEPLEHLRLRLRQGGESAVLVVEEDGTLSGIATRSSLLVSIPYSLILVDHNELEQAVPGAASVEILEIIDHHKLGNPPTSLPITFITAPVGSTCTIVASLYRERGLVPDRKIAALLLAGILSDTVILRSATTSDKDREMVLWLEGLSGLNHNDFGREIFAACGGFASHLSPEEAVRSDFKHFTVGAVHMGVGQVEVMGFEEFHDLKEDLRAALKRIRAEERLPVAGLMVTDIHSETTLFLVEGMNQLAHVMGFPQCEPHLYELKGVMSRKKQLLPHLMKVMGAL